MSRISSINGFIKTGVMAGLLAGTALLYASNPIKEGENNKSNEIEVVSREGAEAIMAMNLLGVQQTTVPTTPNHKINTTLRKFAKNEEERKAIEELIKVNYEENGIFLGTALIQHEIDRQQLFALLEENEDLLIKNNINPILGQKVKKIGPVFYKSVRPYAKNVDKYIDDTYTPTIYKALQFDHKPTAKEVVEKIDNIVEKKVKLDFEDVVYYHTYCDNFKKNRIKNRTDDKAMSDFIAYKMFIIDKIIIRKILETNRFFNLANRFSEKEGLVDYYNPWMDSVEPKAN